MSQLAELDDLEAMNAQSVAQSQQHNTDYVERRPREKGVNSIEDFFQSWLSL